MLFFLFLNFVLVDNTGEFGGGVVIVISKLLISKLHIPVCLEPLQSVQSHFIEILSIFFMINIY